MGDFQIGYNRALIDVRNKLLFDMRTRDSALGHGRKVGPQGESIDEFDERIDRLRIERDFIDSYIPTIDNMMKD